MPLPSPGLRRYAASGVMRAIGLGTVWLALMEGSTDGLWFGALVVGTATSMSLLVLPPAPRGWRPRSLLRFGWFFLRQSLRGGIDVARRALQPGAAVAPRVLTFETGLTESNQQVLMANITSLMPGTVTVEQEGGRLVVHVLDESIEAEATLRELARLLSEAA